MKATQSLVLLLFLPWLWTSCSDKRLMAYHENDRVETLSFSPTLKLTGDSAEPVPVADPIADTLQFKNQLEYSLYNLSINKDFLSQYVSTSAKRIPTAVVDDITKSFYSNLEKSGQQRYFIEQPFSINDVQLYETTNSWNIYVITLGSPFETKGYMVGCYSREKKNFILKDVFEDKCATYTFKAPNIAGKGLKFSIYENYTCDSLQEEIYNNEIAVLEDTLVHERIFVAKNNVSASEESM